MRRVNRIVRTDTGTSVGAGSLGTDSDHVMLLERMSWLAVGEVEHPKALYSAEQSVVWSQTLSGNSCL